MAKPDTNLAGAAKRPAIHSDPGDYDDFNGAGPSGLCRPPPKKSMAQLLEDQEFSDVESDFMCGLTGASAADKQRLQTAKAVVVDLCTPEKEQRALEIMDIRNDSTLLTNNPFCIVPMNGGELN